MDERLEDILKQVQALIEDVEVLTEEVQTLLALTREPNFGLEMALATASVVSGTNTILVGSIMAAVESGRRSPVDPGSLDRARTMREHLKGVLSRLEANRDVAAAGVPWSIRSPEM